MEGRFMSMTLSPKAAIIKKQADSEPDAAAAPTAPAAGQA